MNDHDYVKLKPTKSLNKLKNELSKELYSITKDEAIARGICVDCKLPVFESVKFSSEVKGRFYSEAGRKEYYISGLCEYCWDAIFKNPE